MSVTRHATSHATSLSAGAALYESPACQQALRKAAWRTSWLPSNMPRHWDALEHHQQLITCCPHYAQRGGSGDGSASPAVEPTRGVTREASKPPARRAPRCLTYVRNQKAGSLFLYETT